MPVYSSLRTFIKALKSGETNTTQTFARALAAEGVDPIKNKSSVDPHLSAQLEGILASHGMSPGEINHVKKWPAAKRNQARLWVLAAVRANRSVAFSWELFDGTVSTNGRSQTPVSAPVRITFRSPRAGVTLSQSHGGQVHVKVP